MSSKPNRILVVDDDPEWRVLMTEVLEGDGYAVGVAEDGLAALAFLPRFKPSVVLTDLNMPAMDGRQLIATMRERGLKVPVIVTTSDKSDGHAPEVPGAFSVLEKALPVEGLLSALKEASAPKARPRRSSRLSALNPMRPILALASHSPRLAGAIALTAVMVTSAAVLARARVL